MISIMALVCLPLLRLVSMTWYQPTIPKKYQQHTSIYHHISSAHPPYCHIKYNNQYIFHTYLDRLGIYYHPSTIYPKYESYGSTIDIPYNQYIPIDLYQPYIHNTQHSWYKSYPINHISNWFISTMVEPFISTTWDQQHIPTSATSSTTGTSWPR